MAKMRNKLSDEEKKKRRREQKKLIMRRLREKLKSNPQALEEKRRKDREYYYKKKEQGLVKTIKDLTPRDQRKLRKKWRQEAKIKRENKKMIQRTERIIREGTPPSSPLRFVGSPSEISSSRLGSSRIASGKIVAQRNRRALKAENLMLRHKLKAVETKLSKYRMREQRNKKTERVEESGQRTRVSHDIRHETRRVSLKKKVKAFLEDDQNSRLTAGKKETLTRKSVKKQIRYLNDTLLNLHKKFQNTTGSRISYATFCRCRPFWVISPKASSRETCLCALHENTDYMVQALKSSKILNENSALEVAQSICCGHRMKEECLERTCKACESNSLELADYNDLDSIYYYRWVTKKFPVVIKGVETMRQKTIKEKVLTTKKRLIECFAPQMLKFMQHLANIFHQTQAIREIKINMPHNSGLLHMDFSENYNCKYAKETQGAHFAQSKPQLSLHTSVFYFKSAEDDENEQPEHRSFCTVSSNTQHDPVLICAHLNPIIDEIKTIVPGIKIMHFLSDGPTTQYRNRKMFILAVEYLSAELNVEEMSWHFSESGHGKGAPDGVGGCLKREADAQVAFGHDILNSQDFVNYLQERVRNISVIPIDDIHISGIERQLQESEIEPFKGTMRVHQLTWNNNHPHVMHARRLSCIDCPTDVICPHYEIGQIPIKAPFYIRDIEKHNPKQRKKKKVKKAKRAMKNSQQSDEDIVIEHDSGHKRWRYFDIYSDSSEDDIPLARLTTSCSTFEVQVSVEPEYKPSAKPDDKSSASASGVPSAMAKGEMSRRMKCHELALLDVIEREEDNMSDDLSIF